MINPIGQLEAQTIANQKSVNDALEIFFGSKMKNWNEEINPLYETIKKEFNQVNSLKISETQSQALAYRQNISTEINMMLSTRSKDTVLLKKVRQEKFLFYTDGFAIKTNLGEKAILTEAHTSELVRKMELTEQYVEYLRGTNKNLETLGYTIKDIIEYHKYLGTK